MRAMLGFSLAAFLAITAGLAADAKKEEKVDAKKLIGKWEPTDKKDISIEFLKDGKLTIKELKIEGTWKLTGNKLHLALKFDNQEKTETVTVLKLTDEELTTEDSKGKKETLKRSKSK
jgi:uncharacterized protein (TIGR03066 family)